MKKQTLRQNLLARVFAHLLMEINIVESTLNRCMSNRFPQL